MPSLPDILRWRLRDAACLADLVLPRRRHTGAPERILCLVCGGLGDRLMALPALRRVKRLYPRAHLCVVWMHGSLEVADAEFSHVIDNGATRWGAVLQNSAERWDVVFVNVQGVFDALVETCAVLSRAPVRIGPIGPDMPLGKSVYTRPYPYRLDEHATAASLRAIDPRAPESPSAYRVRRDALPQPSSPKRKGVRRIAVHPGSGRGYAIKQWPAERFRELAARLAALGASEVFILAGPNDESLAGRVALSLPVRTVVTRTVPRMLAEIAACDLLIANDSGPAHAAAALDVPVVTIFGPTNPARVSPVFGRGAIVRASVDCAPCFDSKTGTCTDRRCLAAVTVDMVYEAAAGLLRGATPTPEREKP